MKLTKHIFSLTLVLAGGALLSHTASAEQSQAEREAQAQKTEVWEPVPKSVATPIGKAPSDAVILFSGDDLSALSLIHI